MVPPTPSTSSPPPLGPLSTLPEDCIGLKQWKILLLCTAINSFSQRVITYLDYLGFEQVSVQIASNDEAMQEACESWNPDLVVCPFLTRVIPGSVFKKWITLVVHPGPPGDAGPSSLDWVLLGDDGSDPNSSSALSTLLTTPSSSWPTPQRSHWGTIVFQANEHLDGGAIWAWEQYALPSLGTLSKAQLYQTLHSQGAISALIHAVIRVYQSTASLPVDDRVRARPLDTWQSLSVTDGLTFQGGQTHERPLIQAKVRRPDFGIHTAEDVKRIIYASDSQPGAQLAPLTGDSKTSLFAYGAHLHLDASTIPAELYTGLGYATLDDVPHGTIIAQRDGAVLFKTRRDASSAAAAGVWITHGRVPKKAGTPLEPKVPMAQAIQSSGHGAALTGVSEWPQETFEHIPGTWQEVYVKSVRDESGRVAQCVYWEFYNGACSTRQCQMLLRALHWAVEPERGNVKVLALMGGSYFSNGIALNTIEASSHPGQETWANINAIDDIVEFLVSDTSAERSPFMRHNQPLCERGIVTVACVRGNAAAGGVALAAGCDVVLASRGVVLNPAYRAMGLHGSEFHSYSYLTRCGETRAAAMLRDMLPQSSTLSRKTGLVDIELGTSTSTNDEIDSLCIAQLRRLLQSSAVEPVPCAPWSTFALDFSSSSSPTPTKYTPLTDWMSAAKRESYRHRTIPPLLHYRNEELSQMLLDSFHPVRSNRYHERRYKFIRKVKSDATASRYVKHRPTTKDEEETEQFDNAPGWVRGEEWAWAGLETPKSIATSEGTRIPLYKPTPTTQIPAPVIELAEPVTLPPGAAAPDPTESINPENSTTSLEPPPPAMAISTFSADTVSFNDDLTPGSTDRASSSEDGTTIITPEPRRSGFFKRQPHTRGLSSTSQFSKTSPALTPEVGDQTISKRSGRFKTFSKRLSGAFTLKPPPQQRPSLSAAFDIPAHPCAPGASGITGPSGSPRLENVTKSTRASLSVLRDPPKSISHRGGMSISSPLAPSPKAVYNRPKVKGADVCEFGCLYEPNGATTTRVKGLEGGEEIGEMGSGVMRPDTGRAFGVARAAPPPPTQSGTVA